MPSQAPAPAMASPHRMLLPVLAFCQLIVAIDYNIVLVALPMFIPYLLVGPFAEGLR